MKVPISWAYGRSKYIKDEIWFLRLNSFGWEFHKFSDYFYQIKIFQIC